MAIRKNIFIVSLFFMAAFSLQSCGKFHTEENGSVSVTLSFIDKDDRDEVTIDDAKLWIFNGDGGLVCDRSYHSASELALQRYFLEPGRYLFVTAVNLVDLHVDGAGCERPGPCFRAEGSYRVSVSRLVRSERGPC